MRKLRPILGPKSMSNILKTYHDKTLPICKFCENSLYYKFSLIYKVDSLESQIPTCTYR